MRWQTVAFPHCNNLSAQLPIDLEAGELAEGGMQEQAAQCLRNIHVFVEHVGHVMEGATAVPQLGITYTG